MVKKFNKAHANMYRRARQPGNGIGGQISTWVPQIDAYAVSIELKFGSSGVDSSVGLSTGAALMIYKLRLGVSITCYCSGTEVSLVTYLKTA